MCSSALGRLLRRMPWLLHYLSVFVPLAMSMVSVVDSGKNGRSLPPIYWNTSNPLFREGSYTININDLDILEIYCPNYNGTNTPSDYWEYYTIYIVNESQYNSCDLSGVTKKDLIVNCTTPNVERIFTIFVQSFNPIPNSRDYAAGTYYFITTSTGDRQGINNRIDGACANRNMKVKMIVCCTSSTKSSPQGNTTLTTRAPSHTTARPSDTTRSPTTTTTRRTTRPTTTTTRRTTKVTTSVITTTTKLPGGKPHDPTDIIIDAPGTLDNVGVINGAVTLNRPSKFVLLVTAFLLTFALFSR